MSLVLKVKKLDPCAQIPRYALTHDAGLDLFCLDGGIIQPGEQYIFHTGIAVEIPSGHVGLVWERSGLSFKKGLKVMGGVVDSGYRGEVPVCLLNTSSKPVDIEAGTAVGQILIQPIVHAEIQEVEELSGSERGTRGFGSTGL